MTTLPIVQTFLDKPVRFFPALFEIDLRQCNTDAGLPNVSDLRHRNDDAAITKYQLRTWAIPVNDYAEAVGYPRQLIHRFIQNNLPSFQDYFRTETILDRGGRQNRATIMLAVEMCDALTMRLQASRIKDPEARARVIRFQRWVPIAFHMLRTGRLRAHHSFKAGVPAEYQRILSLPPGRVTAEAVREVATAEGLCVAQVYHRLQVIRGSNAITHKGVPKKRRSDAGKSKQAA